MNIYKTFSNKILFGFFMALVIVVAGYFIVREDSSEVVNTADINIQENSSDTPSVETSKTDMIYTDYPQVAQLIDVTSGKTLQGVKFSGESSGIAYQDFKDEEYKLYATFSNLPVLEDSSVFYEGWIVGGSQGVVSTGALEFVDGKYINNFMDTKDLSDSARYVLTIEPNDNNPAPADHVVEADFEQNNI